MEAADRLIAESRDFHTLVALDAAAFPSPVVEFLDVQCATDRDSAIEQLRTTADAALSALIIQQLKENLNRL